MVMIYSLVYRGLIETTEVWMRMAESMSMWARAKGIMVRPRLFLLIFNIVFRPIALLILVNTAFSVRLTILAIQWR